MARNRDRRHDADRRETPRQDEARQTAGSRHQAALDNALAKLKGRQQGRPAGCRTGRLPAGTIKPPFSR